jgi:hypothetical protein
MGAIIRENKACQEQFDKCVFPAPEARPSSGSGQAYDTVPIPALVSVISIALNTTIGRGPEFTLRCSAAYAVQSYLCDNQESQLALTATLRSPPPDNPNETFTEKSQSAGSMIVASLIEWESSRKDPFESWFASILLCHILQGNVKCKELALKMDMVDTAGLRKLAAASFV